MSVYYSAVVEGPIPGSPAEPARLDAALNRLGRDGWIVRYVLPNGVNRWTIIASRDDPSANSERSEP